MLSRRRPAAKNAAVPQHVQHAAAHFADCMLCRCATCGIWWNVLPWTDEWILCPMDRSRLRSSSTRIIDPKAICRTPGGVLGLHPRPGGTGGSAVRVYCRNRHPCCSESSGTFALCGRINGWAHLRFMAYTTTALSHKIRSAFYVAAVKLGPCCMGCNDIKRSFFLFFSFLFFSFSSLLKS